MAEALAERTEAHRPEHSATEANPQTEATEREMTMTHPNGPAGSGPSGGAGTGPKLLPTNGSYAYRAAPEEHPVDRRQRERFWRSLGRKVRAGARIR